MPNSIIFNSTLLPPRRGPWTHYEDRELRKLYLQLGPSWSEIALRIPSRTPKQIRERWVNHLDPLINKNPFTEVERTRINYRFLLVGPQWSRIAQEISSSASKRTPLMVRNYWIRNERRIEHVRRNASLIDSGTHQQTFAARKNQISKSTFQRLTPYINERYPFKYEEEEEEVPEEIINEIQLRIQEAQEKLNNLIETSKINVPTNGGRFLKEQLDFTQLL